MALDDQKTMLLRSVAQQPLFIWAPFLPVGLNLSAMVLILVINNAIIGGWQLIPFLHVIPLHAYMVYLTSRDVNWFSALTASLLYPRTSKNFLSVKKGVKYVPS